MGKVKVEILGRGMAWLDTGTPIGLLEASSFIEAIQRRQGFYIACLEEIAYNKGWIDKEKSLNNQRSLKIRIMENTWPILYESDINGKIQIHEG